MPCGLSLSVWCACGVCSPANLLVVFLLVGFSNPRGCSIKQKFFRALGRRIRELRKKHKYSQEDMISF